MTKEELKTALKDFGSKGKEIADEIYAKLEEEKATMDTETRRVVRKAWACIAAVTFLIGVGVGHLFF